MNWQMGLELCQLFHLKLKEKKKKKKVFTVVPPLIFFFTLILSYIILHLKLRNM